MKHNHVESYTVKTINCMNHAMKSRSLGCASTLLISYILKLSTFLHRFVIGASRDEHKSSRRSVRNGSCTEKCGGFYSHVSTLGLFSR